MVGARNALQPGWCSHRSRNSSGSNAARRRHHLPGAAQHVRRRRTGPEPCDIGAPWIRLQFSSGESKSARWDDRHRHQVAVRQHRALGPARGSAGVEQPRQRRRVGVRGGADRLGGAAAFVRVGQPITSIGTEVTGQFRARSSATRTPGDAGIIEDLLHLAGMQLVVDRARTRTRPPRSANISSTISGRFSLATAMRAPRTELRGSTSPAAAPGPAAQPTYSCWRSPRYTAPRSPKRAAAWSSRANRFNAATHSEVSAKSDRYFVELQPPSTTIVWPLMKLPPVRTQERHRARDVVDFAEPRIRRHLGVDLAEPLVLQARAPPSGSA